MVTCVLAGAAVVFVRPRYARLDLDASKASPPPPKPLQLVVSDPVEAPPPPYKMQENETNLSTDSKVIQQNGLSANGENAEALSKTDSN